MPHIHKTATTQIVDLMNLKPGDLIISEAAFEDSTEADLKAINSQKSIKSFEPTHVSIYTGDYIKPFAHSVQEGYKLPGLRLTKIWDGRHIVFRFNNAELANRVAEIARRWALSETLYDLEKFNSTYQERHLGKQYLLYKKQFFSLPKAMVNGPATPYSASRASQQLADRCRNVELKKFNADSIRRVIKFATRSELFGSVSKGLRCTSFVVSAFQAATLQPIVNICDTKFSFKEFKDNNLPTLATKFFRKNWQETEIGKAILDSYNSKDFSDIFPTGFYIDSKYAIPNDLFKALIAAKDWQNLGSFVCLNDKLLFCNDSSYKALFQKPKISDIKLTLTKGIRYNSRESILYAISKFKEEQNDLARQLKQEKATNARMLNMSTPPRKPARSPKLSEQNGYPGELKSFQL